MNRSIVVFVLAVFFDSFFGVTLFGQSGSTEVCLPTSSPANPVPSIRCGPQQPTDIYCRTTGSCDYVDRVGSGVWLCTGGATVLYNLSYSTFQSDPSSGGGGPNKAWSKVDSYCSYTFTCNTRCTSTFSSGYCTTSPNYLTYTPFVYYVPVLGPEGSQLDCPPPSSE